MTSNAGGNCNRDTMRHAATLVSTTSALLITSLVFLAIDAAERDTETPLDIWILAGQSNMEGQNSRDGQAMPACATPWPDRILSFPRNHTQEWTGEPSSLAASKWIPAIPNTCLYSAQNRLDHTSLGPEMAFAKTLIQDTALRVGFVPMAAGGSSLYLDWAHRQGLLGILLASTKRAVEAAAPGGRLAGMIWVQGEGDATMTAGLLNAAMYEENMKRFVSTVRRELFHLNPRLPVIMAVQATADRDRVFPYIHLVRRHQLNLRLPALIKVDMEGYEMMTDDFTEMYGPAVGVQKVHLTKGAQCSFGEALANAYLSQKEYLDFEIAAARATNVWRAEPEGHFSLNWHDWHHHT